MAQPERLALRVVPPVPPHGPFEAPLEAATSGGRSVGQVRGVLAERVVLSTLLDPFLSLAALAAYSGLSRRTLQTFVNLAPAEALPCYRLAGKILVRRSEFDAWIARYRTQGRPSLVRAMADLGLESIDTAVRQAV